MCSPNEMAGLNNKDSETWAQFIHWIKFALEEMYISPQVTPNLEIDLNKFSSNKSAPSGLTDKVRYHVIKHFTDCGWNITESEWSRNILIFSPLPPHTSVEIS